MDRRNVLQRPSDGRHRHRVDAGAVAVGQIREVDDEAVLTAAEPRGTVMWIADGIASEMPWTASAVSWLAALPIPAHR